MRKNIARRGEELLHAVDLPDDHRSVDLSADRPGRHLVESGAGSRLSGDLYARALAGRCGNRRHLAGVRDFRSALGAGAVDDQ